MKDALTAYAIAAGCWLLWDISLFASADKPFPWSLWWYGWQKEFEFYPFSVIAVLLLVALWLRKKHSEEELIESISSSEGKSNDSRTSTKVQCLGALGLGGAGAMLGLSVYILLILIGLVVASIIPQTFENTWPAWLIPAVKDFVGIPMSVCAGVGFVTARDRDPSNIRPSDLLRGDSHWD